LVAAISATHPLLGNPGATLTRVRDPIAVAEALKSAGLDALEVQLDPEGLPTDGSWLVKPRASAGGRGIHPWRGSPVDLARRVYYQRRVEGTSLSAQFTGLDSGSRCLGIGRQFVGKPGNPFAYRGSLVPWPVNDEVAEQVDRIGSTLAANFSLRGLFGVDFILDGHRVFPVEVNPRYTASVEAHEWASGRSFLAAHLERFGLDPPVRSIRHAEGFVAKLILHADRPLVWPAEIEVATTIDRMPEIADLPWPGTEFAVGDPIATIFASGASPTESWKRLLGRVKDWRRRLWGRT
jgi:predicted ATP-grasp superfamily ATP-dependent carboligase